MLRTGRNDLELYFIYKKTGGFDIIKFYLYHYVPILCFKTATNKLFFTPATQKDPF